MKKGNIIFLNGVSSSGKTSLAKMLQSKLEEPFYWVSCDAFCNMWPEKFMQTDPIKTYLRIQSGMHHTIKLFSDMGINAIVDHVLVEPYKTLEECVSLLHDYPVLFVHVVCPVEELRRREEARGDREIGQGESQLSVLSPQNMYDITVDTFHSTLEQCADQIIERMNDSEKWEAFQKLWSQMENRPSDNA